MTDQELLQAMSQMMDQKLDAMDQKLDAMDQKLNTMDQKFDTMRKEIMHDVTVLMDAEFGPKFNALAEQIDLILEKLSDLEDRENLETRVSALEVVVKKHGREIDELKKAN